MATKDIRRALHWEFMPYSDWLNTAVLLYDKLMVAEPPDERTNEAEYTRRLRALMAGIPEAFDSEGFKRHSGEFAEAVGDTSNYVDTPDHEFEGVLNAAYTSLTNSHRDIDYYTRTQPLAISSAALIPVIHQIVPAPTQNLSINQIQDFRLKNELRRAEFQSAAGELIKSFGDMSTEEEANRVLRLVEESLRKELKKLKTIYRHTGVEATTRSISAIGSPPSIVAAVGSLLHVACNETAGLIAGISLAVVPWLIAREKADMAIEDSPWAYLWNM